MLTGLPFPNIDPIAFEIGPIIIRWYALAYITGLLLGWRICLVLAKRGPINLDLKKFEDLLLESLDMFTKKKLTISVKLQNLNKGKQLSVNQIDIYKIVFKQLKKFVNNPFLKKLLIFYLFTC